MKIAKFIKDNLFISIGVSLLLSTLYYFLRLDDNDILGYVLSFLSCFGLCSLFVILMGVLFPKRFIKDYVEEIDPENYVTVYFYNGYVNGLCKVVKFYGNPNDPDNMEKTYSFMDSRGVYITDKWFYATGEFIDNRCVVCLDEFEYNIIDENGNFICEENYKGMAEEVLDGKVKVGDGNGGVNFVDAQTGEVMWKTWKKEMYYEK